MRTLAALPIHLYRFTLKPFLGHWCRYEPSCSAYGLEAIQKHGAFKGWWLTLKRLLSCRPGGGHGYDPVPERFRRGSVRAPNYHGKPGAHEIVYYEWGDPNAARTVVCVHGLTRNGHDFDLLAAELARRGYRVICPTMPGRGESERLKDPADYQSINYVGDCVSLLDQLGLKEVQWVGTSMGGIIGMCLAALHPGRIGRMVMNDIGALVKKEALTRIYLSMHETPPLFSTYAEADTWLRKTAAPFGISHLPDKWKLFFGYSFEKAPGGWRRSYDRDILNIKREDTKDFTDFADVDLHAFWQKVNIPVLILRGEMSDILDAETVAAMLASNPNAESAIVKGVGHAPALMTDDQILLVARWLN